MGKALSDALRSRVLKASSEGLSARQAAARFGVGISSAIRWISRAKIGEMIWLQAGEARDYITQFEVLDGATEIEVAENRIVSIARQPEADYPVPSGKFKQLLG